MDFSILDIATLKRYKNHFKLRIKHNSSKAELVQAISKHFHSLQIDTQDTITMFTQV